MTLRFMVALDDSPWAEAAGDAAIALARSLNREVLLSAVHVVNVAHASGHLLKDLAGAQVTLEAHRACRAEGAAHLAPHLRRDAHGDPPLRPRGRRVHDRNGLHSLATRKAHDELEALVRARRTRLGHRGSGHRARLLEKRRAGFGHASS